MAQAVIRGLELCVGFGETSMKTCFFFVSGNVMIFDAMNQKQVINRYAKLDSSGFFGEKEGEMEGKTD